MNTPPSFKSTELMPAPFSWVEILAGDGVMKTDDLDVTLEIPTKSYWISKYPVTNGHFAKFIATNGYHTERWWIKRGWDYSQQQKWVETRLWNETRWNGHTQPVVGVSWMDK